MTRLAPPEIVEDGRRRWIFRHPLAIRVTHWINVVCLAVLLLSGLQIFNAHPALYWGEVSTFDSPLLSMGQTETNPPRGVTTVFGRSFDTTGVLGSSGGRAGEPDDRGFPSWLTLPSYQDLSGGRRWHFFFAWAFLANGLVYLLYGLLAGQLRFRLIPTRDQLRSFGATLKEHLLLRFPRGEEARRYNALQKLTYLIVIFVLLPVQLLAGVALSPGMNAVAPILLDVFGGRQSARTVHFVVANLLVLFVFVHVAMVLVSGVWNNLRSMATGWFVIDRKPDAAENAK